MHRFPSEGSQARQEEREREREKEPLRSGNKLGEATRSRVGGGRQSWRSHFVKNKLVWLPSSQIYSFCPSVLTSSSILLLTPFSLFDLPSHANLLGKLEMRLLCEESGTTWNTWGTRSFPGAGCQFRKSFAHTCVCSSGKCRGGFWKKFAGEGDGFRAGLKTRFRVKQGRWRGFGFWSGAVCGKDVEGGGNCLGLGFTE